MSNVKHCKKIPKFVLNVCCVIKMIKIKELYLNVFEDIIHATKKIEYYNKYLNTQIQKFLLSTS